ncbi:MAG: alpha/beta hydrolase [Planctomycetota bacterium]
MPGISAHWSQQSCSLFAAVMLIPLLGVAATASASDESAADSAVTIASFEHFEPTHLHASWGEESAELEAAQDAYRVKAKSFGGAYKYLGGGGQTPDVSSVQTLELEITVDEASSSGAGTLRFLVMLEDRDGTVHKYSSPGHGVGREKIRWNLNEPSSLGEPGETPGFNFSDIQAINFFVDPAGGTFEATFHQLAAVGERCEATESPHAPAQTTYRTERDIRYHTAPDLGGPASPLALDLYYPTNATDYPTVIWLHAGGLRRGNRYVPGELMGHGWAVAAVDYRKYPDAKSPQFLEDTAAATAWVLKNIGSKGGSPDKVVLAGVSAGGYLASMVGLDKRWLAAESLDANQLAAIISVSGQAITHVAVREEKGGHRATPVVDEFAPLHHVRADAPPYLILTGDREQELLGRYEESAYLLRMMQIAGHTQTQLIELPGIDHAGVERAAYPDVVAYLKQRFDLKPQGSEPQ